MTASNTRKSNAKSKDYAKKCQSKELKFLQTSSFKMPNSDTPVQLIVEKTRNLSYAHETRESP